MEHVQKLGAIFITYNNSCDAAASARATTECCDVLRILEDLLAEDSREGVPEKNYQF